MSLTLAAPFAAEDRERPRLRAAARACAFAAAIVAFIISSMTLYSLGVLYDAPGGSALGKLHPATYLAVLALLLEAASRPRPLAYLASLPLRFPGAALFVVNLTLIIAYASLFEHEPVTPLIDSFLVSTILLALYEDFSEGERVALRRALHVVMLANASLGILEFAFHFRLTPYFAGGRPILGDYRSTALFGHPLLNAGSTALYAAMLILGADRALRAPLRLALLAIQLVALVAFGGRTSLALAGVVVAFGALRTLGELAGGRRFDLRAALAAAIVAPLAIAVAAAAWLGGGARRRCSSASPPTAARPTRALSSSISSMCSRSTTFCSAPSQDNSPRCKTPSASNMALRTAGSALSFSMAR